MGLTSVLLYLFVVYCLNSDALCILSHFIVAYGRRANSIRGRSWTQPHVRIELDELFKSLKQIAAFGLWCVDPLTTILIVNKSLITLPLDSFLQKAHC